jgi:hypothetical protein
MRRRLILAVVCLAASLLVVGCKTEGTATATCGAVELFESRLGTINVPRLTLGQYFAVNRATKSGGPIGVVHFEDSNVAKDPTPADFTTAYDSKLQVSFSAEIPEEAKGALTTAIQKATELTAHNLQRRSLHQVSDLMSKDIAAKEAIARHLRNNPGDEIHIVHAVLDADKLDISLAGAATTAANVSVVNYGDFELKVAYECSNTLGFAGRGVSVFFKSVPVGLDTRDDMFYFDSTKEASLANINLMALFQ